MGAGWGSFAVSDQRAVTQEQTNEGEAVACYDLVSGQKLWHHVDVTSFHGAASGDGPRATPAIAGESVLTLGATGLLNCLELGSGILRWQVDVLADTNTENLFHGMSSSPICINDLAIVPTGRGNDNGLAAYHLSSGSSVWRQKGYESSYASPQTITIDGEIQILMLHARNLVSYSPHDGRVLWSVPWENPQQTNCSQPILVAEAPGNVLISTGYGKGAGLFDVRLSKEGTWHTGPVWSGGRLQTKFCSAVVRRGFAFGLDNGILACIDLKNGGRIWKSGRYGHGQIILVEDMLLIQAEDGRITLVAADANGHREIASCAALTSKTWNYPAIAGRFLLVRNDREAACLLLPPRENAGE